MKSWFHIFAAGAILAADLAASCVSPASARGVCLPNSTRYFKCVDGKIADCTKARNIGCKTREKCTRTEQPCDPAALIR
jgi:hypothetical protein